MSNLKIGIIREGKVPPDSRVPLTPKQCRFIMDNHPIEIIVQPSEGRCYTNEEYQAENIQLHEDLNDCDLLMGVKEVPVEQLVSDKMYHFFSHTIKEQVYNRKLLKACVDKNIRLMDYEVLTNEKGKRLIAFGVFAGMVGAHNGILTYGRRTKAFELPRMNSYFDYAAAVADYQTFDWCKMKIVLTGTGRVSSGAKKVLDDMGIREVSPTAYLNETFDEAVYTQLSSCDYVQHKDGGTFDKKDFYANPAHYVSSFAPYTKVSDLMINGIYWDNAAPQFFTAEDMKAADFNIQVIADVTCDIAPVSSIPATIEASTIADPIFGYNPQTGEKCEAHQEGMVDMMTIDNLPNELPRDASESFGKQFIDNILNEYQDIENSDILQRATIAQNKDLTEKFEYLRDYLNGDV